MARICIDEPDDDSRTLLERLVVRMGHTVVGPDDRPDVVLHCAPEPDVRRPDALVHPFSPAEVRQAVDAALGLAA